MQIYLSRDGQQMGPYSLEQIQACLADGSVLPTDLAWHEGMTDWVAVTELIPAAPALPAEKKSFFTLKRVIIGSIIWFVLVMTISIVGLFMIDKDAKTVSEKTRRAQMLGQGAGTLLAVGCGVLWLPWAFQVGKRRREAKARTQA